MDEELRADHLLRRRMLTDRAKVHSTLSSLHARLAGSFCKLSLMLAPAIPTAAAISRHHPLASMQPWVLLLPAGKTETMLPAERQLRSRCIRCKNKNNRIPFPCR